MLEALVSIACVLGFGILYAVGMDWFCERIASANIARDFPNIRTRQSHDNDNYGV